MQAEQACRILTYSRLRGSAYGIKFVRLNGKPNRKLWMDGILNGKCGILQGCGNQCEKYKSKRTHNPHGYSFLGVITRVKHHTQVFLSADHVNHPLRHFITARVTTCANHGFSARPIHSPFAIQVGESFASEGEVDQAAGMNDNF